MRIKKNFALDRFKTRHQWIKKSGVPVGLQGVRLRGIDSVWHPDDLARIHAWVDRFCLGEESDGTGLLLVGDPGRGKTTLAAAVLQECALRATTARLGRADSVLQRPFAFMTIADFLETQKLLWALEKQGAVDSDEYAHHWARLTGFAGLAASDTWDARLAVLDDVGKEYRTSSGWAEGNFDALLRRREAKGYPTIVTTNEPAEGWGALYGQSMGSFLYQAFEIIELDTRRGVDLRAAS